MRKVVVSEFVTLDGVMEAPHEWSFPFWGDDIGKFKRDELFASDAILLGRVTYEGFAAAWPSRTDEEGFADRINSLPKHVATKTLTNLEWNNSTPLEGDVAKSVAKLKQGSGQNILVYGSADLVQARRQHDLVDEYQIMIFPLVLTRGKQLFQSGLDATTLSLAGTTTFKSGVVVLTYVPAPEA